MLGSRLTEGPVEDMSLVKVTLLITGAEGKVRPNTVGSTHRGFGRSAVLKAETRLSEAVGPTEFAIGRKSAMYDLQEIATRRSTK